MWLVVTLIFIITLLYYVLQNQCNYWKNRNIPGPTPWPLIGNVGKNIIGKISLGEIFAKIYREYEGYPFVGVYKAKTPCLLIRDTDFIKNITVKEFKHFEDNELVVDKEVEPLFGRNPFVLKGEEWKKSRAQLTPCFTSGRMKSILPMINEVGKRLVKYVSDKQNENTCFEAKWLCTKFTIDNVAVCAFGIEANCFEKTSSEFEYLARNMLPPPNLKLALMFLAPPLAMFMSTKITPKPIEDKVIDIVKNTINYRKENNISRSDFLDFISEIPKTCPNFTEVDIAAHAASFLTDGFETSGNVMSYLLFDLATNPQVQTKLREEINKTLEKNEDFSYECIQEMSYLEACLNESLRLHPPVFHLTKICTEKYTCTPDNPEYKNISVTVEPETPIILPLLGLHLDSKYFQSPKKFIPERFLNKNDIPKYAFMPFGEGPRTCLGQRFALLQVKVGVAHLVKNFEMKLNPKTCLPLKYDPWFMLPLVVGGLWLDFHKI